MVDRVASTNPQSKTQAVNKLPTGIAGLDVVLHGGLPMGRTSAWWASFAIRSISGALPGGKDVCRVRKTMKLAAGDQGSGTGSHCGSEKLAELRKKAEAHLKGRILPSPIALPDDLLNLIHELEVHQVELDLQNDELWLAQQEMIEAREELHGNAVNTGTCSIWRRWAIWPWMFPV